MEWSAQRQAYVSPTGTPTRIPPKVSSWDLARRIVVFVSIIAGLNFAWGAGAGTKVERIVIDVATVIPATYLVNQLTPDVDARAERWTIRAVGGGLNIKGGCDGMEVVILVVAAFLVAPIAWRVRLSGIALGVPLVYFLNQIRILILFYVNRSDKSLFDLLHTTVLPLAMIALVAVFFYACLVHDSRR